MMKSTGSGATAHLVSVPVGSEATTDCLQKVISAIAGSHRCLLHVICADATSASEILARLALAIGSPAVQSAAEPIVARRKRGRPKKQPLVEQSDTTLIPGAAYRAMLEAGIDPPKRGRGRPRKHPVVGIPHHSAAVAGEQAAQEGVQ